MVMQLLIGSALISVTIVIHVGFTAAAEWGLKREHIWPGRRAGFVRFVAVVVGMTLLLLASISVSVWIWALCLMALGMFPDAATAMYYALVSFTTLGDGEIVLHKEWRLLSALMSANGLLIFGLTTAVLVDFLAHLRRR
jgi:hypothetical protein